MPEIESELLLFNVEQLCAQARREPEKTEQCLSMIARTIAAARVRVCEACFRKLERGHKFRRTMTGIEHLHCNFPDSYLTPDQYRARFHRDPPAWYFAKSVPS